MTDYDWHPSEDDLVLHFYGEAPDDLRLRVAEHLDECSACRADSHALARTLHLAGTLRAPDPGPDFEDRVWTALRPHLPRRRWAPSYIAGLGAWAATVTLIVAGTWMWAQQTSVQVPATSAAVTPADTGMQERVLLSAVDAHLAQAEMLFVELLNTSADEPNAFTYARYTADDLVSFGRLYRETARATGDMPVAMVLDDLETVLVEVARGPEEPRAQDIRAIQGRIEEDDLLFKVRVVALDIRDRQSRIDSGEGAL